MPQTVLHREQGLQRAHQQGLVHQLEPEPAHQAEQGLQRVHLQEHARQREVELLPVHQREPGRQHARQQEVEHPPVHLQEAVPDIVAVVEVTTDLLPEVEVADTVVLQAVAGMAVAPEEAVDSAEVPEVVAEGDKFKQGLPLTLYWFQLYNRNKLLLPLNRAADRFCFFF